MMDLSTEYMGLALKSPLIASASPLNSDIGNLKRLEDAGAGAVVLPSLFEEQLEAEAARHDQLTSTVAESFPEALSYFPETAEFRVGPEQYLDLVQRASEGGRHSRHREPQRRHRSRLDRLRQAHRTGRRERT